MERVSARATGTPFATSAVCLPAGSRTSPITPGNPEQQQWTGSPSYLSSRAWDSRSSRKISLPPCQQEPASLPAVLVHSSEAGDSPNVTTKHRQQPNRPEKRSSRGREERESSLRLCSWAHLWVHVTPPGSLPSLPLLSHCCYDLIVSG